MIFKCDLGYAALSQPVCALQVAQLVTGGWGRASAVVAGDPPRLFSWGITSEKPAKDAERGAGYVQGEAISTTH